MDTDEVADLDEVSAALRAAQTRLDQAIARRRQAMKEHEAAVRKAEEQLRLDGGNQGGTE